MGILPLKVGDYWEYREFALGDSGTVGGEIGTSAFKISRLSVVASSTNRDTVFHWVYVDVKTGVVGNIEFLYRNFDSGLYMMGGVGPEDTLYTKLLRLSYPVQKGETWISPHLVYNLAESKFLIPDSQVYRCTDTSASFETPLGNFTCLVYNHMETLEEVPGTLRDVYDYYVAGVGRVGSDIYNYRESTQERYPLSRSFLVSTNVPLGR